MICFEDFCLRMIVGVFVMFYFLIINYISDGYMFMYLFEYVGWFSVNCGYREKVS